MTKILIVDDDQTLLEMYRERLAYDGHEIMTAQNGEIALDLTQSFCPDLILMDVMMPRMNGLETVGILQSNPQTAKIPVIFLTQLSDSPLRNPNIQSTIAPTVIFKRDHTPQTLSEFVRQYLNQNSKGD